MSRPSEVRPQPLSGAAELLGLPIPGHEVTLTGITHDSRAVRPGDVYAALPGARFHGADFAANAVAAGAVAVLTDPEGARRIAAAHVGAPVLTVPDPRARMGELAAWVYGRPGQGLLTFGTTGTNGKTTVSYLLEGGLRAAGRQVGVIGTVEIRVGDLVVPSVRTTPEATDLQALFAVMREQGASAVAMEVSSHALALGRVDGTVFDVALFTNLSQDHLDFHPTMEDYFRAKAALFTPERSRAGVVDVDGSWGRRLVDTATVPVTTVSPAGDPQADWRAEDVELGPAGSTFTVVGPDGQKAAASVRLPGPFNVANALLAVVSLTVGGMPLEQAAAGVAAVPGVPGRMEAVDAGQSFLAVVDFAHTADAVETLLTALREVTTGKLILVLGCGGDRDRSKRAPMGAAAARLADLAVLTSDNPRSEDPLAILDEMLIGVDKVAEPHAEVIVEPDRAEAIALAVRRAGPGDVLAVAGKGHELGQEFAGGHKIPFDDRVQLRAELERAVTASHPGRTFRADGGKIPGSIRPDDSTDPEVSEQ